MGGQPCGGGGKREGDCGVKAGRARAYSYDGGVVGVG